MTTQTFLVDMPIKLKGYTVKNDDDTYTIFLNSRANRETQLLAYQHEMSHIKNGDFERDTTADCVEFKAHNLADESIPKKLTADEMKQMYPNTHKYFARMRRRHKKERKELEEQVKFEMMMVEHGLTDDIKKIERHILGL